MGIYDVPAAYLIEETAGKLVGEFSEPEFTGYVKSGRHRERAPQRKDWFYVRSASILYRAYKHGIVGTERLRSYYGGKRNRGLKTEHHYKASGKVIRSAIQSLEKSGYLERTQPKGRKITGKGVKLLTAMSKVAEKNWQDGKYKKAEKVIKHSEKKDEPQYRKKEKIVKKGGDK
jgi:small subunit ribosomal protein S19e